MSETVEILTNKQFVCIRKCTLDGHYYKPGDRMTYTGSADNGQLQYFRPIEKHVPVGPDVSAGQPMLPSQRADRANKIREALALLDPDEDSHWTQSGSPRISVLEEVTGYKDLTVDEVRAAQPMKFLRSQYAAEGSPPPLP